MNSDKGLRFQKMVLHIAAAAVLIPFPISFAQIEAQGPSANVASVKKNLSMGAELAAGSKEDLKAGGLHDHKAQVFELEGEVRILKAGSDDWKKAEKKMVLEAGDQILTGKDSHLDVAYDAGFLNIARIEEKTKAEFRSIEPTDLHMEDGTIFSALEGLEGERYQISTPTAVAGVRGTELYTQAAGGEFSAVAVVQDLNLERVSEAVVSLLSGGEHILQENNYMTFEGGIQTHEGVTPEIQALAGELKTQTGEYRDEALLSGSLGQPHEGVPALDDSSDQKQPGSPSDNAVPDGGPGPADLDSALGDAFLDEALLAEETIQPEQALSGTEPKLPDKINQKERTSKPGEEESAGSAETGPGKSPGGAAAGPMVYHDAMAKFLAMGMGSGMAPSTGTPPASPEAAALAASNLYQAAGYSPAAAGYFGAAVGNYAAAASSAGHYDPSTYAYAASAPHAGRGHEYMNPAAVSTAGYAPGMMPPGGAAAGYMPAGSATGYTPPAGTGYTDSAGGGYVPPGMMYPGPMPGSYMDPAAMAAMMPHGAMPGSYMDPAAMAAMMPHGAMPGSYMDPAAMSAMMYPGPMPGSYMDPAAMSAMPSPETYVPPPYVSTQDYSQQNYTGTDTYKTTSDATYPT